MKPWMALLLATAALSFLPSAEAHSCNGMDCGPCVKGENHAHNDAKGGQCSSGPGFLTENGYGGQKASPGSGVFWTLVALVGASGIVLARRA
jgi:hypothetical protein